ncbi:hypothetical protein ACWDTQ_26550 [Streptomyces cellulosae]
MSTYTNLARIYRIDLNGIDMLGIQLPDGIERTPELDALVVAFVESYQAVMNAIGARPETDVKYTEITTTQDTTAIAHYGVE